MKINETKKVIEMGKKEYDLAMTYGTKEYKALREIRNDFPGFKPIVVKAKKAKSDFANLDMKTIKAYVEKHGNDEQKEHFSFITKRTVDADGEYCEAQSFFQIKAWFLAAFPEIKQSRKDYREKIQSIYDAAKQVA